MADKAPSMSIRGRPTVNRLPLSATRGNKISAKRKYSPIFGLST